MSSGDVNQTISAQAHSTSKSLAWIVSGESGVDAAVELGLLYLQDLRQRFIHVTQQLDHVDHIVVEFVESSVESV
jgi:hypothetical protein